LLGH
jgi:hypothetical protein